MRRFNNYRENYGYESGKVTKKIVYLAFAIGFGLGYITDSCQRLSAEPESKLEKITNELQETRKTE